MLDVYEYVYVCMYMHISYSSSAKQAPTSVVLVLIHESKTSLLALFNVRLAVRPSIHSSLLY